MNKFQPFHALVLVEKLDKPESKSVIITTEGIMNRFWKVKIIAKGTDVPESVSVGDICFCNPLSEIDNIKAFGDPNYRLINFGNILGRWDE